MKIEGLIGTDCEVGISVDRIELVGWEFGLKWMDEEHLVAVAVQRDQRRDKEDIRIVTLEEMLDLAAEHHLKDKSF